MKHNDTVLRFVHYNGNFVKIWEHDGSQVFFSGAEVTYVVDGAEYKEFVNYGQSCLSPTVVTPTKSGWEFAGWRKDTVASGSVEPSVVMNTEPITLYAVFSKAITLTYKGDGGTATTKYKYGTRYYNNGNYNNPSFVMKQTPDADTRWKCRGWTTEAVGDAPIVYADGATITLTGDLTIYASEYREYTLTYYDNKTTPSYKYGTGYWVTGNPVYPNVKLTQIDAPNWSERGWSTSNKGDASITYANGATITLTDDITLYGLYSQTITLSYAGNGATGGSTSAQTGTRYWAPAGYVNPTFTLKANGFTRNGYTFNGWDLGAVGAKVTLSANKTATAKWTDNAWTWVNNYVGSGDALTVTITDADNIGYYYPVGTKLSEFKVAPDRDVTEQAMSIYFQTNAVNTKGCKYMTIVFEDFYTTYANDGNGSDGGNQYIQVKSSSGATIKEIRGRKYGATEKIDVSSASKVYLYSRMGAWAYNGTPSCKIKSISFSN